MIKKRVDKIIESFPNIKKDLELQDLTFIRSTDTYILCRYILLQEQTICRLLNENARLIHNNKVLKKLSKPVRKKAA